MGKTVIKIDKQELSMYNSEINIFDGCFVCECKRKMEYYIIKAFQTTELGVLRTATEIAMQISILNVVSIVT